MVILQVNGSAHPVDLAAINPDIVRAQMEGGIGYGLAPRCGARSRW